MRKKKKNNPIKISFWGVRGSIPAPSRKTVEFGGNTSCVSIEYKDEIIILDAGSGIRVFGNNLIKQGKITGNKLNLFISHTHWDHIQGLPFFASAFIRGNSIRIYGPKMYNQSLQHIISSQMEYSYFPIRMEDLGADFVFRELGIRKYDDIFDDITVETCLTNHPVLDMGYKFTMNGKSIAYVTDMELFSPEYFNYICKSTKKNFRIIGKEIVKDLQKQFEKFVYNVDFLIIDSFCTKEEYKQKIGWGHSCFEDVYELACKSKVKQLCFFHHDPNRTDFQLKEIEKKYQSLNRKQKKLKKIFAAREESSVIL